MSSKKGLLYEISSYSKDKKIPINDIEDMCREKHIQYKKIFKMKDKVLISFDLSTQSSFFMKNINEFLDLKLEPYELPQSQGNSYDVYSIEFNRHTKDYMIRKKMWKYFDQVGINSNFIIKHEPEHNSVYYYILKNDINPRDILGTKIEKNNLFEINNKTFYSYLNFYKDFVNYLYDKGIEVDHVFSRKGTNVLRMKDYSKEKMDIINAYIKETEIQLSDFAMYELKSRSKDTFLFFEDENYLSSLKDFIKSNNCNVDIVYFERKIILYGPPKSKEKIKQIICDYSLKLSSETMTKKVSKDQVLLFRYLFKSCQSRMIAIFFHPETNQIEFRKKYLDFINLVLGKEIVNSVSTEHSKCEICLENLNEIDSIIQLRLCGHSFCVECIKMQICNNPVPPIKCVKCNNIIANSDIKEILTQKEMKKFSYSLIKDFIMKNKNYMWCTNPDCEYIYDPSQLNQNGKTFRICPNCDKKFCLVCHKEIKFNVHDQDCQRKLLNKVDKETRRWMLENTVSCPVCFHQYEKTGGCNHMTCNFCRPETHFCYICKKVLDNGNPLSHFSDPKSSCKDRLYENFKPQVSQQEIDEIISAEQEEETKAKEDLNITQDMLYFSNLNSWVNAEDAHNGQMERFLYNSKNNDVIKRTDEEKIQKYLRSESLPKNRKVERVKEETKRREGPSERKPREVKLREGPSERKPREIKLREGPSERRSREVKLREGLGERKPREVKLRAKSAVKMLPKFLRETRMLEVIKESKEERNEEPKEESKNSESEVKKRKKKKKVEVVYSSQSDSEKEIEEYFSNVKKEEKEKKKRKEKKEKREKKEKKVNKKKKSSEKLLKKSKKKKKNSMSESESDSKSGCESDSDSEKSLDDYFV